MTTTNPGTGRSHLTARPPAWSLTVVAMLSVQLGAALSVGLFPIVGAAGTGWLRLVAGAVILLGLVRPRPRDVPRAVVGPVLALGVATGATTLAFLAALDRIPLGTTVAIEFLGPLTVAAVRAHDRRMLAWPALALAGVLLLTRPWAGGADVIGMLLAALAAAGWGSYILLTQHVGDRVAGLKGLALSVLVAALAATPFGLPQAAGHLTPTVVLAVCGLAVLLPVVPFALEMLALRRLTATAFGTLMALEPGIAVVIGAVVLHQALGPTQVAGVALVVGAGVGAERRGRRHEVAPPSADPRIAVHGAGDRASTGSTSSS
jgi:inner membrane transporter RhtA